MIFYKNFLYLWGNIGRYLVCQGNIDHEIWSVDYVHHEVKSSIFVKVGILFSSGKSSDDFFIPETPEQQRA